MHPDGRSFSVSGGICLMLAAMLLVLPLQWVLAVALAALVHELCHALAVFLCGRRVDGIMLGARGAEMAVDGLTPGKELFCALAGPIGSLLLLFLARRFPRLAICGAFHGIYNLLPVYPLDGGRALRCLGALLPGNGSKLIWLAEQGSLWLLTALAAYAFLRLKIGILPGVLVAYLWWKRKITPCNEDCLGV